MRVNLPEPGGNTHIIKNHDAHYMYERASCSEMAAFAVSARLRSRAAVRVFILFVFAVAAVLGKTAATFIQV